MIKAAIEKILDLNNIERFFIEERNYTSKGLVPVKEPEPDLLKVTTLTALADYINTDFDQILPEGDMCSGRVMVHVVNPFEVVLRSNLVPPFRQRFDFMKAHLPDYDSFHFGSFYNVEEFVIKLQSLFVQDETTASILKLVGNIQDQTVKTAADDGMTQEVKVKSGITRVEEVKVINPVVLRPYRTFREIEQPASKFVLRLKQTEKLPVVALFEADGGVWRIEAMKSIAHWIADHITPVIPIIM